MTDKKHPLYRTWCLIIQRCRNPEYKTLWNNYGGRGIRVCDRWADSFIAFVEDMGPRPEGCTIDRVDNNGHYEPGNCRWATHVQQMANRRRPPPRPRKELPVSARPRQLNRLSALAVQRLTKPGRHADGGNLYLYVGKTGGKKWTFFYQLAGRQHEMGLGSARDVGLAKAREKAAKARETCEQAGSSGP